MSDERDERDDADSEESNDERTDDSRGFRFEVGLRPLSDVLGSLVEVKKTDVPDRSEETVEWEYVEEDESDETDEDDSRRRSREGKLRRSDDSKGQQSGDAERGENEAPRHERKTRIRPIDAGKVLANTHREDDEFVVTADIYGVGKDDLSVGIDPKTNELVVGANDIALKRVALPWDSAEASKVHFNNGVLEVRLRPKNP